MWPGGSLDVSMTSELGDALLTIIKHDVAKETPESTARRRVEVFVLRAEALVARLAVRQEILEQTVAIEQRRLTAVVERGPVIEAQQTDLLQQVMEVRRLLANLVAETTRAQDGLSHELAALRAEITGSQARIHERLVQLEQARPTARVNRLCAYIVGTVRTVWRRLWR
jgi:Flp pilus assembly secretin CpaC